MKRTAYIYLFLWVSILMAPLAHAHKPSDSYLALQIQEAKKGTHITGQWDIALRDLEYTIGLDEDQDGSITWGELHFHQTEVAAYALPRLNVRMRDAPCVRRVIDHLVDNHTDGAYTVLRFEMDCPKASKTLEVGYSLFFDLDPTHRGLMRLTYQGQTQTAIFSPDQATQRFELDVISPWRSFFDFGWEGVWHIFLGFDHVLFLISLLLPSVLTRESHRWQAVLSFRVGFWDVVQIVSAFTLAHSITLSVATLDIFQLPSRFVESAIAASIILAALNNLYPVFEGRRWIVAFTFGLIHGFGFAGVLMDLGLPPNALALALVGFNLGVEAGQLAIVCIFLPLAFSVRSTIIYQRHALGSGSYVVIVLASIWMVERMFNLKLLPF